MSFPKNIFSVKKQDNHKIFTILGIKVKIRSAKSSNNNLKEQNEQLQGQLLQLQHEQQQLSEQQKKLIELVNTLSEKVANQNKTNSILNREKNILNWKVNKIVDDLKLEDLKEITLQQKFFYNGGEYAFDIEHPKTFNEKIQWLRKYYLLDNETTDMISDKFLFKNYIKEMLGDGYTIPLLGKWDNAEDIDFDVLPDKFVLKSNCGGDGNQVYIVKDKTQINKSKIIRMLREWIMPWGIPYYYAYTPIFKNIKPCIIAEEYMPIRENEALEYKMFCFNGKLGFCLVEVDYFGGNPHRAYYDKDFNELDYKIGGIPVKHLDHKPETYDKMVEIAEFLAKDFPFVRVDFYDVAGRIYVGEMTFTSGGGFSNFEPVEIDYKLGEMLDITKLQKVHNE